MPVPKMDGLAIDFNLIPGFTSQWPSGNGTVAPFNTPGTAGLVQTDTVKAPEADKPVRKPARKASTRK